MSTLASTGLRTLPIELLVEGRRAVCLGACPEVAWKVQRLVDAGADVVVFAEAPLHPLIEEHLARGAIRVERRAPAAEDAEGAAIVFVSPEHEALGARLAGEARAAGRLVCTLDRPAAATFVNPAVARGPNLAIALASGGRSPALLRRMREDLEEALSAPELVRFVDRVGSLRAEAARGARAEAGRAAVRGFSARLAFHFPRWFTEGREGPDPILDADAATEEP